MVWVYDPKRVQAVSKYCADRIHLLFCRAEQRNIELDWIGLAIFRSSLRHGQLLCTAANQLTLCTASPLRQNSCLPSHRTTCPATYLLFDMPVIALQVHHV